MPYALVVIGLLMIISGINNTYAQFGSQLQTDLGGSKGFIVWAIALAAVGALGYIKDLRQFSHYFMALILISFVLSNKGVFQNFTAALSQGPKQPQAAPDPGSAASPLPQVQTPGAEATTPAPAKPHTGPWTLGDIVSGIFKNVLTSPAQ